ncbi:MAG: hypothetical protein WKF37_23140, partial [Bryobacteraceae bacterium]
MHRWLTADPIPDSLHVHEPVFFNTVGHSIGVLVFGFLLLLLIRDLRSSRSVRGVLPVLATLLAVF